MDETPFSSSSSDELSAEDLAIIQMFDEMTDLEVSGNLHESPHGMAQDAPALNDGFSGVESPEDMLMLFASEAEEDIGTMRRALHDLEQDNHAQSAGLVTLGRAAHKLKGTAGAMGCEMMSTIAWHIEEEIQLIKDEKITVMTGLSVLVHALKALELTLQSVVDAGQESALPLQELLQERTKLNAADEQTLEITSKQKAIVREDLLPPPPPPAAPFDMRQLHALISHTERLIDLNTPLQGIQKEIARSLMELQAAYGRLHYLENVLSTMAMSGLQNPEQQASEHSGSSLVARILQRANRQPTTRTRSISAPLPPIGASDAALWDEMEMDRFTEQKILLQSFSEAVADVATASSQLKTAYAQMDALLEQQARQTMVVRNDALRLRSVPFGSLLERVRHIVQALSQRHKREITLEAVGETTEIDQDILELLATPLLDLIRTNVTDSLLSLPLSPLQEPDRIWLSAQAIGNEIVIELGFSMPIPGGALEALRGPLESINGQITPPRRNQTGGVVFQLRFPRAQGLIQGLLVQISGQGVILPLSHIELIDYKRQESQTQIYHLATLLGFPPASGLTGTLPPPIILANTQKRVAIQVDEIIGKIELIMRPLEAHLQRPGIVGNAVDGAGNILLVIDLPALMRYTLAQQSLPAFHTQASSSKSSEATQPATILVADDSVYIRQSLRQTFERAGYIVVEARDGIEALDCLSSDQPPTVMLLDIEMPNLNGYDLLNILHSQPGFVDCKTIMLTSRSSDKHRQRAMELGAYAFLGKPCSQEILLDTVYKALSNMPAPA